MLLSIIGLPTYNGPGMTRISITMKHGKENDRTGDCSESPCKARRIEWRSYYPIVVELPCSTTPSPGQSSTNTEYSAALPGQRLGLVQSEGYYGVLLLRTKYSIPHSHDQNSTRMTAKRVFCMRLRLSEPVSGAHWRWTSITSVQ